MTKRFFTSDQHIGHELVSVLRMHPDLPLNGSGRPDLASLGPVKVRAAVEEHKRILAENWDRVVGPEDTVFVLGDISINPKRDGAWDWFRNRPGKKHLIAGNHDEVHPMHSKALQAQQDYNWGLTFNTINPWVRLKIQGRTVLLSHFPYQGEGTRSIEDRNVEYRLKDAGFPLLHGHTHDKVKYHLSENNAHQLHVGVDAWDLELVPESTVTEWLEFLPPSPQGT